MGDGFQPLIPAATGWGGVLAPCPAPWNHPRPSRQPFAEDGGYARFQKSLVDSALPSLVKHTRFAAPTSRPIRFIAIMNTKTLLLACCAGAVAFSASSTLAATYAENPTGSPVIYVNPDPNYGVNVGSVFRVTDAIAINQLGIWDEDGNGLLTSHDVGLYTIGGSLLASAVVPAGTGAVLDNVTPQGGFRWVDLMSDVVLQPGREYVLSGAYYGGGTTGNDDPFRSTPATINSPFQLVGDRYLETATYGLVFPTGEFLGPNEGWFGPNARYYVIPEPGVMLMNAVVLIGAGIGGWIVRRRALAK